MKHRKSVYFNLSALRLMNPLLRIVLEGFVREMADIRIFNTYDEKSKVSYYHSGIGIITLQSLAMASDLIDEIEFSFALSDKLDKATFDSDCLFHSQRVGVLGYGGRRFSLVQMNRQGRVLYFRFKAEKADDKIIGDDLAFDQGAKKDCCEPRSMLAS